MSVVFSEKELDAREALLLERSHNLDEKEFALIALSNQLADLPHRAQALHQKEEALRAREEQIRNREDALRLREKVKIESPPACPPVEILVADPESHRRLEEANRLVTMARDIDALSAKQSSVERARLLSDQQAFNKERVDRVHAEDHRLEEERRRLTQWEIRLSAQEEQYLRSQKQVEERHKEVEQRLASCQHLERSLMEFEQTLRSLQGEAERRSQECGVEHRRLSLLREDLELRELRVEKREKDVKRLIEKHQLESELKE